MLSIIIFLRFFLSFFLFFQRQLTLQADKLHQILMETRRLPDPASSSSTLPPAGPTQPPTTPLEPYDEEEDDIQSTSGRHRVSLSTLEICLGAAAVLLLIVVVSGLIAYLGRYCARCSKVSEALNNKLSEENGCQTTDNGSEAIKQIIHDRANILHQRRQLQEEQEVLRQNQERLKDEQHGLQLMRHRIQQSLLGTTTTPRPTPRSAGSVAASVASRGGDSSVPPAADSASAVAGAAVKSASAAAEEDDTERVNTNSCMTSVTYSNARYALQRQAPVGGDGLDLDQIPLVDDDEITSQHTNETMIGGE